MIIGIHDNAAFNIRDSISRERKYMWEVWGLRYWDYGGAFLNFHGYICFLSALGFGIAGTVWICFLSGFITRLWLKLPLPFRNAMNTILLLAFAVDCAAALIIPNVGKGITFSYNIGTLFLV